MRDWNTLADKALVLQAQSNHVALDHMLLDCLIRLLHFSLSDDTKKERLRCLLTLRWTATAQTNMDYTFNPQHPINQLYLEVAEKIATEDEAVCQILMPTVKKIIGTGFAPEDVVSGSVTAEGQFILPHFLINVRGDALIALLDVFEYGAENTNRLFPSEIHGNELFDLTAEDRERIRKIAGEASENYFEALEKIHRIRHKQKPSVGWALKELVVALLKSSKIESGTEYTANVLELRNPILKFYKIWRALPHDIKNKIKNYRVNAATLSFESYLLCLFVHAKEQSADIVVSESEFRRVMSEEILPCTHQIGLQLDTLLKQHLDLFNMPLPGMEAVFETEAVPNKRTMLRLAENFQHAVKTHSALLDVHDACMNEYFSMMEIFAQSTVKNGISVDTMEALAALIKNYKDLTRALQLLPSEQWESFFSILKSKKGIIKHIFLWNDDIENLVDVFCYLFTALPTQQWKALLDALYDNELESIFNSYCVGRLFGQLPEAQWPWLKDAVYHLLDVVFVDADDIASFLNGIEVSSSAKIISFFEDKLNAILQDPWELGYLFSQIDRNFWHNLHGLFRPVIHTVLIEKPCYNILFEPLSMAHKGLLLNLLYSDSDFLSDNPVVIVRLLSLTDLNNWEQVFYNDLGPARLSKFVRCENSLIAFLTLFNHAKERIFCIHTLSPYLASLKISPIGFFSLLTTFPECEEVLIKTFKEQLVRILTEYLLFLPSTKDFKPCVVNSIHKDFIFLAEKILPALLSSQNISAHCESYIQSGHKAPRKSSCDVVVSLCQQMHDIEMYEIEMNKNEIPADRKRAIQTEGCLKKLELLNQFINAVAPMRPNNTLQKELIAYFGKDFFSQTLRYTHQFITVCGVRFFPKQAVKIKKIEMVPASRRRVSMPLMPIRPSTAPTNNPSFMLRGTRLFTQINTESNTTRDVLSRATLLR